MTRTYQHLAEIGRLAGMPYALAHLAGCMDPDVGVGAAAEWSPGARWLARVADDAAAIVLDGRHTDDHDVDDVIHEAADGAVPIYTADRWRVFADLGAWADEGAQDLGAWCDGIDPTQSAGIALYAIARRLIGHLLDPDALDVEDVEDDEDDDQ